MSRRAEPPKAIPLARYVIKRGQGVANHCMPIGTRKKPWKSRLAAYGVARQTLGGPPVMLYKAANARNNPILGASQGRIMTLVPVDIVVSDLSSALLLFAFRDPFLSAWCAR